ncbi:MAG TPA: S-adenosylmethionine:tRNA ribosyltransferase-isomerase [Actinocrinis sp.]|nr:S-adenosylmethionine:tRNA ribosyltransferase-isomerase [Actinocrinis sp.]
MLVTTSGDLTADKGFTVPDELSAHAPAEARGLRRDDVRMLVGVRAGMTTDHRLAVDLPKVLRPGDLLVVNNSTTLPAALTGTLPDGTRVAVHVSAAAPDERGEYLVELRRITGTSTGYYGDQSPAHPDLVIALPGDARMKLSSRFTKRLWYARFASGSDERLVPYLLRHGKPIRYSYVDRDWPLADYQTVFATEPGSSEMPSAARPFTAELVARLVSRGVLIAPITLHTGVASPEAHETPYAERFIVPQSTAALVNHVRATGGRVIAIGTTAVRALESAVDDRGRARAADGWTDLVITPERGVRLVDGLLTGWHEPEASHLLMLEAVAGRPLLDLCYAEALRERYLWHEFGDVNLLLNG